MPMHKSNLNFLLVSSHCSANPNECDVVYRKIECQLYEIVMECACRQLNANGSEINESLFCLDMFFASFSYFAVFHSTRETFFCVSREQLNNSNNFIKNKGEQVHWLSSYANKVMLTVSTYEINREVCCKPAQFPFTII